MVSSIKTLNMEKPMFDSETGSYATCSCDANRCSPDVCPECALYRIQDAKSAFYHLQDILLEQRVKLPTEAVRELHNLAEILGADFLLHEEERRSMSQKIFSDLITEHKLRDPYYG